MIVKTINGNVIVGYEQAYTNGKNVRYALNYDPHPDAGWGHNQKTSTAHYPEIERDVPALMVFMAYLSFYKPEEAYNKLKEINFKFQ